MTSIDVNGSHISVITSVIIIFTDTIISFLFCFSLS